MLQTMCLNNCRVLGLKELLLIGMNLGARKHTLKEDVEWRRHFFEALDLKESELNKRFGLPGMKETATRKDIFC